MCKYFEIEIREADVSPDCLVLTAKRARALIDENTIGVSAILGSTFNGAFLPIVAPLALIFTNYACVILARRV
jgi:glutamate decarboxylase